MHDPGAGLLELFDEGEPRACAQAAAALQLEDRQGLQGCGQRRIARWGCDLERVRLHASADLEALLPGEPGAASIDVELLVQVHEPQGRRVERLGDALDVGDGHQRVAVGAARVPLCDRDACHAVEDAPEDLRGRGQLLLELLGRPEGVQRFGGVTELELDVTDLDVRHGRLIPRTEGRHRSQLGQGLGELTARNVNTGELTHGFSGSGTYLEAADDLRKSPRSRLELTEVELDQPRRLHEEGATAHRFVELVPVLLGPCDLSVRLFAAADLREHRGALHEQAQPTLRMSLGAQLRFCVVHEAQRTGVAAGRTLECGPEQQEVRAGWALQPLDLVREHLPGALRVARTREEFGAFGVGDRVGNARATALLVDAGEGRDCLRESPEFAQGSRDLGQVAYVLQGIVGEQVERAFEVTNPVLERPFVDCDSTQGPLGARNQLGQVQLLRQREGLAAARPGVVPAAQLRGLQSLDPQLFLVPVTGEVALVHAAALLDLPADGRAPRLALDRLRDRAGHLQGPGRVVQVDHRLTHEFAHEPLRAPRLRHHDLAQGSGILDDPEDLRREGLLARVLG